MTKSKTILEICLSPDLGGLELFMIGCYKDFKTKIDAKVSVSEGSKLDKFLETKDIFYLKRNKFFPILPANKLAKYIDKNEIDIVHFHWTKDIATVVLAKFLSKRKPKVVQTRNMTMTRFKDDFYHKWLYKNIDMMHAVTRQVKEQLTKFIPQDVRPKIEVVYMGTSEQKIEQKKIDKLKEKYNLKDEFIVGIVGRIEEGKGQYLLIDALSKLSDLNIKVLIVGHTMDKSYLEQLKQKVKTLGLEGRVIFTGFTKEVNEHFRLMDVSVLATQRETFGLVVIESMVNKVVVIATNNGGPLEIIQDGVDGLLFDRSSEDLAKKIQGLYSDAEYKYRLSEKGYLKARSKFYMNKQSEELFQILNKI